MSFPDYTIGVGEDFDPDCDLQQFCDEMTADPGITAHDGATIDDSVCTVLGVDPGESAAVDAVVDAHVPPTALAACKLSCIETCRYWRSKFCDSSYTVEHPGASGKYWSLSRASRQFWADAAAQSAALGYPFVVRTFDGLDSNSFADAAAVEAAYAAICAAHCVCCDACEDAEAAIVAAVDIQTAEAARDAYIASL